MKKVLTLSLISILFIAFCVNDNIKTNAEEEPTDNFEVGEELPDDYEFTTIDKDGNISNYDMSELEKETKEEFDSSKQEKNIGGTVNFTNGVVNFKTKSSASLNTSYTEDGTNRAGYVNGYYAADGAFLGYNSDGSKVKFIQAGVTGWVDASEVQILDYDNNSQVKSINFYRCENGILYHYGTNNLSSSYYWMVCENGVRQSYMSDNTVYYSYDGHYFYTSYASMISDYKANTRSNSINPNNPYYNYYQYLSHRTKTSFSASDLDAFLLKYTNSSSKMYNQGNNFINNQNAYGVNAALMFGVACNESNYGTSSIAINSNNIFGHAAYDSDPNGSANRYSSVGYSIYYHAKVFISEGYLDTKDYSGRYYGSHLGDKASGINVKYASGAYWGEIAAAICWKINRTYPGYNDSGKYAIAIKDKGINLNVRKEPTTASNVLYQTGTSGDYPFIILEKVSGETVNGSNVWYKIQSDTTLNDSRTALTQDNGDYDYNNYYGYIHSSYVDVVSNADKIGGTTTGGGETTTVTLGDVNMDGKVGSADYLIIKDYIMGKISLNANQIKAADVNKDGKVGSADYLKIKDYIMGKLSSL